MVVGTVLIWLKSENGNTFSYFMQCRNVCVRAMLCCIILLFYRKHTGPMQWHKSLCNQKKYRKKQQQYIAQASSHANDTRGATKTEKKTNEIRHIIMRNGKDKDFFFLLLLFLLNSRRHRHKHSHCILCGCQICAFTRHTHTHTHSRCTCGSEAVIFSTPKQIHI